LPWQVSLSGMRKMCIFVLIVILISGCGKARTNQKKKHLLHKGNIAVKEKLYDEAVRYYLSAIELDGGFAQAYNNLGIVYMKMGEFLEASLAFDQCIEQDPDFTDAYYNRSTANYELGNFRKSLTDLDIVKHVYEPEVAILFSKGLAFFGLKNYDSSAHYFSRALQFDARQILNIT
jgi:tetratricopeptide (TPR) repeat protein